MDFKKLFIDEWYGISKDIIKDNPNGIDLNVYHEDTGIMKLTGYAVDSKGNMKTDKILFSLDIKL